MLIRLFSLVFYLLGAVSKDFSGVQKPYVRTRVSLRCQPVPTLVTRDALRGHTVSKNGSISFFFHAGCPEGAYCV